MYFVKRFTCQWCEEGIIKRLDVSTKPYFCTECYSTWSNLVNYYKNPHERGDLYYFVLNNGLDNSVKYPSVDVDDFSIDDQKINELLIELVKPENYWGGQENQLERKKWYSLKLDYVIGQHGQKTLRGMHSYRNWDSIAIWLAM